MQKLTAMFLGTAAACLAVVALGERVAPATVTPPDYHRICGEHRAYQVENQHLRSRVAELQEGIARDRQRRAAVAQPVLPLAPEGDDLPPAARIPAQTLPTTPKE